MHWELVVNNHYGGINPVQFGFEECAPSHSFGPAVRTHWLLHYIVKGKGYFTRNGKKHTVEQGDIFVIPPYLETYYIADNETPWEYIWIGFEADIPLPDALSQPVAHCSMAGIIFEEMRHCQHYESGKSAYLCSCIWKLLAALFEDTKPKESYIDKALSYIHSEYGKHITVQDIADKVNLDRSHLSRIFKKHVGSSPSVYLRNYRLNRAAELITSFGEKPSVAAYSVGYDDLFHFSKNFKSKFGISPREYANKHKS